MIRPLSTLAIIVMLASVLLYAACSNTNSEPEPAPTAESEPDIQSFGERGRAYFGLAGMEELILEASAVARVQYVSAEQTIEINRSIYPNGNILDSHVGAVVVTFNVLEYLDGSGSNQIKVVLRDGDWNVFDKAVITAANEDLLAFRDKRWDDRQAIVFLGSGPYVLSTVSDSDRYYLLGDLRANDELGYTVDSKWAKAWLPAAAAPGAQGASGDAQQFITNLTGGASSDGASGQSAVTETMTLAEIKAVITRLDNEITAGGGTDAYRECLTEKYYWASRIIVYKAFITERDGAWNREFTASIDSGAAAGTQVYTGGDYYWGAEDIFSGAKPSWWADGMIVISGRDADLFEHTWPLLATTVRPLPAGTYRFHWAEQSRPDVICNAMPDEHKTRDEIVVTVTAPEGTVHETMFDPATLASGVGADGTNGVLEPSSFSVDGTSTSITSLKWDNGSVVLTLSPHVSLSSHKLDFIDLDGSVSLSLETSSATADSSAGTLTWTISDQPWHDGDTLMLRISPSSLTPSVAPDTPQTPTGQTTGLRTVSLDWADVPGASSYRIRYWRGTAGWLILPGESITLDFDGSSVTISGLPDRGLYSFSIQAVNAVGSSGWSGAATVGQGI